MRKAILVLHRKIWSEAECTCGSKMIHINGFFQCKRQLKNKEPKNIEIKIPLNTYKQK